MTLGSRQRAVIPTIRVVRRLGLGLETKFSGLGLGLETSGLGLGFEAFGLGLVFLALALFKAKVKVKLNSTKQNVGFG